MQNADASGRLTNLKAGIVPEISWSEPVQWRSVRSQGLVDSVAVWNAGGDEDTQIFRRSRLGMCAKSIPAHNKVLNAMFVERV